MNSESITGQEQRCLSERVQGGREGSRLRVGEVEPDTLRGGRSLPGLGRPRSAVSEDRFCRADACTCTVRHASYTGRKDIFDVTPEKVEP